MNRKLLILASAFATTFASAPVLAGETGVATRTVSLDGIDLTSAAGHALAARRIALAVRVVCGDADFRDIQEQRDMHRCRSIARNGAQAQLDAQVARAEDRAAQNVQVAALNRR